MFVVNCSGNCIVQVPVVHLGLITAKSTVHANACYFLLIDSEHCCSSYELALPPVTYKTVCLNQLTSAFPLSIISSKISYKVYASTVLSQR